MSELKPCPFCGGEALLRERYIQGIANRKHYRRECRHCKATFADWYRSMKKADEAWNRRAQPANEPLVTRGECVKYQTPNCAAKHEQALMDFCSHGIRKPGGEQT